MAALNGERSDELIRLLAGWQQRRVVVVGDLVLDRYVYGDADRLSADSPVPVLSINGEQFRPGGAANVCFDLRALGCQAVCAGVVGDDEAGARLKAMLRDAGCATGGLITVPRRPTTVRHHFVGLAQHRHPQKIFRADEESTQPLPSAVGKRLVSKVRTLLRTGTVLCLEDVDLGVLDQRVCRSVIELARRQHAPVLIDPAAIDDYSKYRGATAIVPNRTEAARASGVDADGDPQVLARIGRKLARDHGIDLVLLTLGADGMLLLDHRKPARVLATQARAVYDVSGAGEMVLAMLAAARANEASWPAAAELANVAAGLAVEKFGAQPVDLDEVLLLLLGQRHEQLGKVRTLDQLVMELGAHRRQGKKIAFTNGCFDILHAGHVTYLRQAAKLGDLLVVAINGDDSIRRIKGPDRPVNRAADRLKILGELESIDYLIVFDRDTPIHLLKAIKPDVLVKGGDYTRSGVVGGDLVEQQGGQVALISEVKGKSTTNLIRRITRR